VGVVLPAPAISQALRLGHCREQLGIEELVPEATVEQFGKTVLSRRSWLHVGRAVAAVLAPALEGVGNELRPVVAADIGRCRFEAGEFLQHRHHVFGPAAPPYPDGQAESAVLVDHIQELEPPPIGVGVELKVHRPHLLRVLSLVSPHRAVGGPCPLLLARSGRL